MKTVVYFISGGTHIKIGTTGNLNVRLHALQTSSMDELSLLGSIPGDAAVERKIHTQLAKYRGKGEWFLDCSEVRSAIIALCGNDIFAALEKKPEASPLGKIDEKLEDILRNTKNRLREFTKYCVDGVEKDRFGRLWKVHVVKRYMIMAAIDFAWSRIKHDKEAALLLNDEMTAAGRLCAHVEMCEAQVQLILGDDRTWFLSGWKCRSPSNPLFEILDGKIRWNTFDEAVANGWESPSHSVAAQLSPWLGEDESAAA